MNILVVGNFYSGAFGLHISETLKESGHNVFRFEPGFKFSKTSIFGKRWNNIKYAVYNDLLTKIPAVHKKNLKPLFNIIKQNEINLTIVLHDYLTSEEVKKIKESTKSPVVLWFPDAFSNFKKSMFFISGYDFLFFVDKYIADILKADFNLNTFYLPQACFPKYHHKTVLSENEKQIYACDITNAGNMYPSRIALYKQLDKYDIKMWGNLPPIWAYDKYINSILQKKFVHHDEKAKAFNGAKIVLNNLHPAVINGTNKRTFETTGCGGFLLTKYHPALGDLFEIGKEIEAYKNFDDMIEKIDYYLKHDNERKKIADAGYKRAHKDHTLEIRLNSMLKIIFG